MFNTAMKWLVPKLEDWCQKTGRVLHIHGTDAPEDVYLVRYFLFRSNLFSIYIHRFLRSDRDDHHDHPFDFLGYVVTKGYRESLYTGGIKIADTESDDAYWLEPVVKENRRNQGTWGFREAEATHMVLLDEEYKLDQAKEAPLTVIFRGPYRRKWGFWKYTGLTGLYKWTYWRTYLNVPDSDTRE